MIFLKIPDILGLRTLFVWAGLSANLLRTIYGLACFYEKEDSNVDKRR